jgi:hypothetical protein
MFEDERFESFLFGDPDLETLSKHIFFLSQMEITRWRLGYLMLNVRTMMNPFNASLLIPLSLTPLMGFLSFSLP